GLRASIHHLRVSVPFSRSITRRPLDKINPPREQCGRGFDAIALRVDAGVYTTGKSKAQKENARAFLEEIGDRKVGETELVEAILKRRYTREAEIPNEKTYKKDL